MKEYFFNTNKGDFSIQASQLHTAVQRICNGWKDKDGLRISLLKIEKVKKQ